MTTLLCSVHVDLDCVQVCMVDLHMIYAKAVIENCPIFFPNQLFLFFFYLRGPLFLTAFVEFSFSKIPYILVLRIPVPYLSVWKIYGIGMMRQNDCHSLFFGGCLTLASQECYSVAYYRSKRKNWLVLAEITRKFENLRTLHTFSEVSLR